MNTLSIVRDICWRIVKWMGWHKHEWNIVHGYMDKVTLAAMRLTHASVGLPKEFQFNTYTEMQEGALHIWAWECRVCRKRKSATYKDKEATDAKID